jgi:hypothetical protein
LFIVDEAPEGNNMVEALLAGLEGQAGGGGEEDGQQAEEATHLEVGRNYWPTSWCTLLYMTGNPYL